MTATGAATTPSSLKAGQTRLLGVRISHLTVSTLLAVIEAAIDSGRRANVLYANIHGLNLAYEQPSFRALYQQADFVLCDGFGIKWAASLVGQSLPARLTPPDWLPNLVALAARRGFSVFFLGNQPGVAEQAAARLTERCPTLKVAGTHHGYFDKARGGPESEHVIRLINAARPQILYVGFGMPMQEQWLLENWDQLDVKVGITAGAMLDYVAGVAHRGPRWMTDHGLEWLGRLLIEPGRLWKRYLIGIPLFVLRLLRQRLGARR